MEKSQGSMKCLYLLPDRAEYREPSPGSRSRCSLFTSVVVLLSSNWNKSQPSCHMVPLWGLMKTTSQSAVWIPTDCFHVRTISVETWTCKQLSLYRTVCVCVCVCVCARVCVRVCVRERDSNVCWELTLLGCSLWWIVLDVLFPLQTCLTPNYSSPNAFYWP